MDWLDIGDHDVVTSIKTPAKGRVFHVGGQPVSWLSGDHEAVVGEKWRALAFLAARDVTRSPAKRRQAVAEYERLAAVAERADTAILYPELAAAGLVWLGDFAWALPTAPVAEGAVIAYDPATNDVFVLRHKGPRGARPLLHALASGHRPVPTPIGYLLYDLSIKWPMEAEDPSWAARQALRLLRVLHRFDTDHTPGADK